MVSYVVFEEGIEVNGTSIMAVIDGMGAFKRLAHRFLERAGLPGDIVADEKTWYSQQKWLDAFKLIAQKIGPNTLFLIGTKIPENAVFPPEVNTIEKGLQAIDVAYHMNHRNSREEILFDGTRMKEGIGHYHYEKSPEENMVEMKTQNPYPCDFDMGIISAMTKRFNPNANVMHNDSEPCRKDGAESCSYIITW